MITSKIAQNFMLSRKPFEVDTVDFIKKVFSIFIVLIVSWSIIFPISAWASVVPITVQVDIFKGSGKGWDIGLGYPDIAICIESESDFGRLCLPEGNSIETVKTPQCKDSFTCAFSARVPNNEFKISVIDVDLMFNDLIGSGFCEQGKVCAFGKARVEIGKAEDKF